MINFYRRYIPNCAQIIAPIRELTKNRAPSNVEWGDRQEKAFAEIKRILSNEPVLRLPDLNQEFSLQTDASNQSLGGCLLQTHDGFCVTYSKECPAIANPRRSRKECVDCLD